MGLGGIYFRQTLPYSREQDTPTPRLPPLLQQASSIQMTEIESGDVSQMVDSSSSALLEEIHSKARKLRFWPWALGLSISIIAAVAALEAAPLWYFLIVPVCAGSVAWAAYADKLRKTVVLFYQLEPHIEEAYQNLHNSFASLRGCSRLWHIESKGDITTPYEWKVNAGASAIVKRSAIIPGSGAPPYFECNVSIPVLPAGRQRLYFLPDRILVWDTNGVGSIGFEHLQVDFSDQRFIEEQSVPPDSRVVDTTWRYVNKSGGPDRRFKDNREIPIVIYEAIRLTSKSGLQELYHLSRTGVGAVLDAAGKKMALAISQRGPVEGGAGYIKCPCNNCDVFLEFRAHGVGQTISCPHCGLETVLFVPGVGSP